MDVDDWTVDVQNLDFGREPTNRQRPTNWQLRTLANSIEKETREENSKISELILL
jgi:hypothetical protein